MKSIEIIKMILLLFSDKWWRHYEYNLENPRIEKSKQFLNADLEFVKLATECEKREIALNQAINYLENYCRDLKHENCSEKIVPFINILENELRLIYSEGKIEFLEKKLDILDQFIEVDKPKAKPGLDKVMEKIDMYSAHNYPRHIRLFDDEFFSRVREHVNEYNDCNKAMAVENTKHILIMYNDMLWDKCVDNYETDSSDKNTDIMKANSEFANFVVSWEKKEVLLKQTVKYLEKYCHDFVLFENCTEKIAPFKNILENELRLIYSEGKIRFLEKKVDILNQFIERPRIRPQPDLRIKNKNELHIIITVSAIKKMSST